MSKRFKRFKSDMPEKKGQYSGAVLLRSIPETTKNAFKGACSKRGKSMRDVMIQLMRKYAVAVDTSATTIRVDDIRKGGADRE
jgi:hypothetical protein